MTALSEPVHVGTVNGKRLRFFRGPSPEPRMPFHAHADLLECLELPPEVKTVLTRKLINHWKDDIKSVATTEGIVTIAPHYVAQGLISSAMMLESGTSNEVVKNGYEKEGAKALGVLANKATGDLGVEARLRFSLAAVENG